MLSIQDWSNPVHVSEWDKLKCVNRLHICLLICFKSWKLWFVFVMPGHEELGHKAIKHFICEYLMVEFVPAYYRLAPFYSEVLDEMFWLQKQNWQYLNSEKKSLVTLCRLNLPVHSFFFLYYFWPCLFCLVGLWPPDFECLKKKLCAEMWRKTLKRTYINSTWYDGQIYWAPPF